MIRQILSRLGQGVVVLFVLFTITFFLVKAMPNGPFDQERALDPEVKAKLNARYGLDKPVWTQYRMRLGKLVSGNLDTSFRLEGRRVSEIIGQAFPVSFQLGIVALVFAIGMGVPLGVLAAWKKNTLWDYSGMAVAMIGICIPSFVIGPILADNFGREFGWFPVTGWVATSPKYWILPAITLGLIFAAYISRLTRAGMLDTLNQDYVRTARAKGVDERRILIRHCLRGGLIPVVAYIGPAFAGIVSGSLVIEMIFAVPGLGTHFIKSIETADEPVILGIVMLFGSLVTLANIGADVVGVWLNPRLRESK